LKKILPISLRFLHFRQRMKPVGAPTPTTFVLGITYCLLYSKSSLSWGLVPISLSSSSSSLQWRSGDQMTSHRRRHDSVVGATLSPCNPQVGNSGVFSLSMTGQQPQQYELSRLLNCKVSKQRQEQSQPHASQRELTSRDDVSSVDTEHDTRRRHLLLRAISISSSLLLVSVADTSMAAAAVVAPPSASTVSPSSNILTGVGGDIGGGLQPATDEQPQIPFPDTATLQKQQQQASLEGTNIKIKHHGATYALQVVPTQGNSLSPVPFLPLRFALSQESPFRSPTHGQ
jgi:hypothetical protein